LRPILYLALILWSLFDKGWQKDVSKSYGSPSDLKIKHRYLLESLAWERQGVSL